RALRLDEQVNVVAQYRELHDARAEPVACSANRQGEHAERAPASQTPDVLANAKRDVNRSPPLEPRPAPMRHPGARSRRLPPGPLPFSAPSPEREIELSPHLIGLT